MTHRNRLRWRGLPAAAVLAAVASLGAASCASDGTVRATFTPAASPGSFPPSADGTAADPTGPQTESPDAAGPDSDADDRADGDAAGPENRDAGVIGADGTVPEPLDKPDPRAGGRFVDPPTGDPAPEPVPRAYATDTSTGGSATPANLVGVEAEQRDGWEEIIFTFVGSDSPPEYAIDYVDAVRPHDEADPIPLDGGAFLQVDFTDVDPTQDGVMAIPSDVGVDQSRIHQLVLAENVGGELRFGVSLADQEDFQVRELADPTRLVIQVAG